MALNRTIGDLANARDNINPGLAHLIVRDNAAGSPAYATEDDRNQKINYSEVQAGPGTIDIYTDGELTGRQYPTSDTAVSNKATLDGASVLAGATGADVIKIPRGMQLEGKWVPTPDITYEFGEETRFFNNTDAEAVIDFTSPGNYDIQGHCHFENIFTLDDGGCHCIDLRVNDVTLDFSARRIEVHSVNAACFIFDGTGCDVTMRISEAVSHEYDVFWLVNSDLPVTKMDINVGFAASYGGTQSNVLELTAQRIEGSVNIDRVESSGRVFELQNATRVAVNFGSTHLIQKTFALFETAHFYEKNAKIEQESLAGVLSLWARTDAGTSRGDWDLTEQNLWIPLGEKDIGYGKIANGVVQLGDTTTSEEDLAPVCNCSFSVISAGLFTGIFSHGSNSFPESGDSISCNLLKGRVEVIGTYSNWLNIPNIEVPTYDAWTTDETYSEGQAVIHARLSDAKVMVWRSKREREVLPEVTWDAEEESNWREWGEYKSIYSDTAAVRIARINGDIRVNKEIAFDTIDWHDGTIDQATFVMPLTPGPSVTWDFRSNYTVFPLQIGSPVASLVVQVGVATTLELPRNAIPGDRGTLLVSGSTGNLVLASGWQGLINPSMGVLNIVILEDGTPLCIPIDASRSEKQPEAFALTDAQSFGGAQHYITGGGTVSLPFAKEGMSFSLVAIGNIGILASPKAGETIVLDGIAKTPGANITSNSQPGDRADFQYYGAGDWYAATSGLSGRWN